MPKSPGQRLAAVESLLFAIRSWSHFKQEHRLAHALTRARWAAGQPSKSRSKSTSTNGNDTFLRFLPSSIFYPQLGPGLAWAQLASTSLRFSFILGPFQPHIIGLALNWLKAFGQNRMAQKALRGAVMSSGWGDDIFFDHDAT